MMPLLKMELRVDSLEKIKLAIFNQIDVFSTLTSAQLTKLAEITKEVFVPANYVLIHEHEIRDELYILCEGEVEIFRKDMDTGNNISINTLSKGSIIGEMSLLDNAPRSASVRTTQPTRLLVLSIRVLHQLRDNKDPNKRLIYFNILEKLAKNVATNIRSADDVIVNSLNQELINTKARITLSLVVICMCLVMSFYAIAFDALKTVQSKTGLGTEIVLTISSIIAIAGIIRATKTAGVPLSLFGLTLKNWRQSLQEAIVFTCPILLLILMDKWFLNKFAADWHDRSLFEPFTNANLRESYTTLVFINLISYVVFVPFQELVVRGSVQGPLQEVLSSPHKIFLAIVISNILFAVLHSHLSVALSLPIFILGLFWGWLYSRHRTLVGVIVSHWLVGFWGIFIVNIIPRTV